MTGLIDAATRGMARGVVSVLALAGIVWGLDRVFGRRQP